MRNKISSIVTTSLPEFIQHDYQLFTMFVKYYFEWLETPDNYLEFIETKLDNIDFDRADEQYIDMFIQDFAETFPKNYFDDGSFSFSKVELVKSIREFYLAKGSEASIRFIFNLLFKKDISFFYPKTIIQQSSNNLWDSIDYAYITAVNFDNLDIKFDSNIFVQGVTSGAGMAIDKITTSYIGSNKVMKLFVSSFDIGFLIGEEVELTVDDVTIVETTYGGLDNINIIDGGTDYKLLDDIIITDSATGDYALAKIESLNNGGFDSYIIDNPGTGYTIGELVYANKPINNDGFGFVAEIKKVGGLGEIEKIEIINEGVQYNLNVNTHIPSLSGSNGVIRLNGNNIGKIKSIIVYESGIGYVLPANITVSVNSVNGINLTTTANTSVVFTGILSHTNELDFPSNYSRIQDSHLYQTYSYVIQSNVSPHLWLEQIKRVTHPAGTIVFGMYTLEQYVESIISIPAIRPTLISVVVNLIGVSTNTMTIEVGIPVLELDFPVNDSVGLDLLYFDLDNTKLLNNWENIEFSNYSLDNIVARELQENKQETNQLDILYVYDVATTYTVGQKILYSDGNVYKNILESTGTAPPDVSTWDIETYTAYNNSVEYSLDDAVFDGTDKYIYINVTSSFGNTPPNATYWALV